MKKLFLFLLIMGMAVNVMAADVWREGTGADVISGDDSPSDIDTLLDAALTEPIDDFLQNYREGCEITYSSATTIIVGNGQTMVSNAAGTIRAMLANGSNTSVTFSNLDTGTEANATYYVYAYCLDPTSDIDFDVLISLSSTTPSGITYYKKLGSFYNDASLNILNDETIVNDNNYYALQLGDWESKSSDTPYLASTDGFAVGWISHTATTIDGTFYTDVSNPPTTARQYMYDSSSPYSLLSRFPFMCPVKSGDYYKLTMNTGSGTIYWIPNN